MGNKQKITSHDTTFAGLTMNSDYLFFVPNYQRTYTWTEKEVDLFLKDGEFCWRKREENKSVYEHFTGQFIIREEEKSKDMSIRAEIIDGQQRITTFMLLVLVTAGLLQQKERGEEAETLKKRYYLWMPKCEGEFKPRLKLSKIDQEFWNKLEKYEIDLDKLKPQRESHKRLWKAAQSIREYLQNLTEEQTLEESIQTLKNYVEDLAEAFRVVLLTTENKGYNYALYQIVNARGLPLTSGELLRARTLELLSGKNEEIERAEAIWNDLLLDKGSVTDRYLTWNYVAVLGKKPDSKRSMALYEQYERDIFHCYNRREISELEQDEMMRQLEQLSVNVSNLSCLEKGVLPVEKQRKTTNIIFEALVRGLKNTACLPLYLKILDMREDRMYKTLDTLTPMLAKAFCVVKSMGDVHDEVISRCYMEIWKKIERNSAKTDEIKVLLEQMMNKENKLESFYKKIEGDLYEKTPAGNGKVCFLLLMAELHHKNQVRKQSGDCMDDSVDYSFSKMSIEHILKDSVDEREVSTKFYQDKEKIGNLTLIGRGLNTKLRDKEFLEKQPVYEESPYWMTRKVAQLEQWKYADFELRQKELVEMLKEAFEL